MKLLRLFVFCFFAIAAYSGAMCIFNDSRSDEHLSAFLGLLVCVAGCCLAVIKPEDFIVAFSFMNRITV